MEENDLLRSRIRTDVEDYKDKEDHFKRFPNAVILSDQARQRLTKTGLIVGPISKNTNSRDRILGEGYELQVHKLEELHPYKQARLQAQIARTPQAIFLGRTTWGGLGKKVKERSLCMYNLDNDLQ